MAKFTLQTIWLKRLWKPLVLLSILLLPGFAEVTSDWQQLGPGIEYQDLDHSYLTPWSHVHAFRIDLKTNRLGLVTARQLDAPHASASEYARHSNALLTINGGFFDKDYQPLGLRINQGQQLSPLKKISWWGVFYVRNNKAGVASARQFQQGNHLDFAVQSGPRLLVKGQIPALKPGRAERSALGITKDGKVIMLITDNAPVSTQELAAIMKAPPLNCVDALNLDGGSSSQLHARVGSFGFDVHGFSNVSDAVIVLPRQPDL